MGRRRKSNLYYLKSNKNKSIDKTVEFKHLVNIESGNLLSIDNIVSDANFRNTQNYLISETGKKTILIGTLVKNFFVNYIGNLFLIMILVGLVGPILMVIIFSLVYYLFKPFINISNLDIIGISLVLLLIIAFISQGTKKDFGYIIKFIFNKKLPYVIFARYPTNYLIPIKYKNLYKYTFDDPESSLEIYKFIIYTTIVVFIIGLFLYLLIYKMYFILTSLMLAIIWLIKVLVFILFCFFLLKLIFIYLIPGGYYVYLFFKTLFSLKSTDNLNIYNNVVIFKNKYGV